MPTLTKKQKQILDYITSYINKKRLSPTIEEIRKHLKLSALSTVHQHIEALEKKGYLSKSKHTSRSLVIKKNVKKIIKIPIIGKLIAYQPNKRNISSSTYFALRVNGDHMSEEGIFDGDIVIVNDKKNKN